MIVLDTHVLIWAAQDDRRLGTQARLTIEATAVESSLVIPAITAWEIAFIEQSGTIPFAGGAVSWMRRILARQAFTLAQLTPEIAIRSVQLDWAHRDPADRMIVATAIELDVPLVTADRTILAYAAAGHVQAIDARR